MIKIAHGKIYNKIQTRTTTTLFGFRPSMRTHTHNLNVDKSNGCSGLKSMTRVRRDTSGFAKIRTAKGIRPQTREMSRVSCFVFPSFRDFDSTVSVNIPHFDSIDLDYAMFAYNEFRRINLRWRQSKQLFTNGFDQHPLIPTYINLRILFFPVDVESDRYSCLYLITILFRRSSTTAYGW